MNEVFPPVYTVSLAAASPGSILSVPRYGGPVFALATDHSVEGGRSLVFLNLKEKGRPQVLFAEKFQNIEGCLAYKEGLRFELGMGIGEVDARGHDWSETSGVIVSIDEQFFMRAAPFDNFYGQWRLVNIQTGSILAGQAPSNVWSLGAWSLCLKDAKTGRDLTLHKFELPRKEA
jgi:hypothetical protein